MDDELIEESPNVWAMKNNCKREELRKQYIQYLPKNQQLAIQLHSVLCTQNHSDGCSWFYEIKDLEDDWGAFNHKKYLEKANKLFRVTRDFGLLKKFLEALK